MDLYGAGSESPLFFGLVTLRNMDHQQLDRSKAAGRVAKKIDANS